MPYEYLPGIGSLLVAFVAAYFTWNAQRGTDRTKARADAVMGFGSLTDALQEEVTACKTELRDVRIELVKVERLNHQLTFENDALKRENEALRLRLGEAT